jgi:integrase
MSSALPIELRNATGEALRISSQSMFGDDTWVLDDPNTSKPARSRTLKWDIPLADGSNLTDLQHAKLLGSSKRFIYLLLLGRVVRGRVKPSTAKGHFESFRVFLQWMSGKSIDAFSMLHQADIDEFVSLAKRKGVGGDAPSHSTVYQRLSFLKYVIELGEEIGDAAQVVFDKSAVEGKGSGESNPIPYIPDNISARLYDTSIRFIEECGDTVLALWDIVCRTREQYSSYHVSRQNVLAREALEESGINLETPWGKYPAQELTISTVRKLMLYLQTACYVLVAGFTGMRVSEISSLDVDCLARRSIDGVETLVLNGSLIKTAVVSAERECWITGPSRKDNPVFVAVSLLERLWKKEREGIGLTALFVNVMNGATLARLTQNAMNTNLKDFASRCVGVDWELSTHQFRKTFARYVARSESMAVLALKRHFKHIDVQMTAHYIGTDLELVWDVADERNVLAAEVLDEVLGSDRLAGKMGEELVERNSRFRGIAGENARKRQVSLLMDNSDLVVLPHRYGLCFYRRDVAKCQGDRKKVGVNTCVGCKNFVVGERHLDYWRERRSQLDEFKGQVTAAHRVEAVDAEIQEATNIINIIEGV